MEIEDFKWKLVQNCFTAVEDRTAAYLNHIYLNFSLADTQEEKTLFIQEAYETKKKSLCSLEGWIAHFVSEVTEKPIVLSEYKHFYDLMHKRMEAPFLEFISFVVRDDELLNFSTSEDWDLEELINEFPDIGEWIEAATNLVEYWYIKLDFKKHNEAEIPRPKATTLTSKRSSKLIGFDSGRSLNLRERYHLMDQLTGLDGKINKLKISKEKKEELLAHILHCNPKNAQQILNGTYDSKFRREEINIYVNEIEKE